MKWIFRAFLVLGVGFLVGCVTRHDIIENETLTTQEKITNLEQKGYIAWSGLNKTTLAKNYDDDPCWNVIMCAIYINDYELTKWLLDHSAFATRHIDSNDDNVFYYKHLIYAPLRYGLSDQDSSRYLKLLISYGASPNVCDYGSILPLSLAYKLDYIESFEVLIKHSEPVLNWGKSSAIECAVDKNSKVPYSSLYKQYEPAPINYAIKNFDSATLHQSKMLTMILDMSQDPTRIGYYSSNYRCEKYSAPSALAFASCLKQNEVYKLLSDYYLTTDRLTDSEKSLVFKSAEYHEKKTLSDTEIATKNAEIARLNKEHDAKIKAQMESEYYDSPVMDIEFQSVSAQLGANNTMTEVKSSSNIQTNASSPTKKVNATQSFSSASYNFVRLLNTVPIDKKFSKREFEQKGKNLYFRVEIKHSDDHVMKLSGNANICTDILPSFDGGISFKTTLVTGQATQNGAKSLTTNDRGISFRYSKPVQETLLRAYQQVQASCK
ncbi:ankyrin repeat domain-containing protein [Vibrio genomosp. F6]|uniref:Uncharacterized protein n=1 Tax=Vibrio genomosp. F6 TaxID=723172 RepID=A0A0H3ZUM2_9VIBR|nr:ankyrin repeat domain-containing protein [Vibrio genomosp. F6]AKN37236.1 hypothetical protein [Vibrio genomosp. F6]TKF21409.1 ankyrin repeat domain-containing protein [Vibrio genomosp. F6]